MLRTEAAAIINMSYWIIIMTLLMYRARWFHYAENDFYEL